MDPASPRCSARGGVYHPASGCALGSWTVLCGPCERDRIAWLVKHTNRRWGKVRFYEQTETSRRVPP